jgi:hypothetical protein
LARRFRSKFVFPVSSPFRLRVSQHLDHAHVSNPRHVERSARISRLYAHPPASHQGLWDLSCRSNFRLQHLNLVAVEQLQGVIQPLPTPPHPAEALALPQDVSAFALTYSLRLRSCKLMDAFVISSLPSRLKETLQSSRVPSLRGRYPTSLLLRTRPPPSRLRSTSRFGRLYDHWDRNRTRHALGEGFPLPLFRLRGGFTVSPWRTFSDAPL